MSSRLREDNERVMMSSRIRDNERVMLFVVSLDAIDEMTILECCGLMQMHDCRL